MNLYQPTHKIRIVSSTSLFDGHDAAINIMRRIMQASGAEIIHLGHNRSALEIVECAIQEDVQGIAITSYQGGHVEFFKYIFDLLKERGSTIKVFGGGGGTILPSEIKELHDYGIARIFSPDDGRELGLQGMINEALRICDFSTTENVSEFSLAKKITLLENGTKLAVLDKKEISVLGVTGTGGAGKSSLVDELVRRFLLQNPDFRIGIISVDPTKKKSGGALLGDRIRMNSVFHPNVFMRSMATRTSNQALSNAVKETLDVFKSENFDLLILESSGIGQSDTSITEFSDFNLYVMTSEYGAATQLEKIDMLDYADFIAINKFEKQGSEDALHDVKKQYKRNKLLWDVADENLPIVGTIASQFNDVGVDRLYNLVANSLSESNSTLKKITHRASKISMSIIPQSRSRYLAEIVDLNHQFGEFVKVQASYATSLYQLEGALHLISSDLVKRELEAKRTELEQKLYPETKRVIEKWDALKEKYKREEYIFKVRDKEIRLPLYAKTLSGTSVPKIALPRFKDWGDIVRWRFTENLPGKFPYTAGVFPLKRENEAPTRMFAGEGGPERTNKRFHYVSQNSDAKRLSTAFDSVTLYGEDPDFRPDIFGKIGNSGVSVATVDDAKRLYSGFDLASPKTSVSMTINGPAPMMLAFFLNAAIDQQCEKYIVAHNLQDQVHFKIKEIYKGQDLPLYKGLLPEGNNGLGLTLLGVSGDKVLAPEIYQKIKADTLKAVRGTVQADILKEDQAQNTCIFSIDFALKMMGDIQSYFIDKQVRNFYSVSISGYHIAEAGANPITQLALTLSNGFTYVEYYLSRGMKIDDFAPNLSFFFSNGVDAEYAVIGRVARRIWAKAMRHKYKANERSQMLKYHIQTSGRSLHASEIAFNDIRTTLQALYAIYDNCNSLHTNAYDEAITTPTEDSVRRAMAIQLIIDNELGLAQNQNPLQGSYIIEELTDLVEEAVLLEFQRISDRGGVLGAMERMYQRSKIQDESMYYESMKHTGELPIIGVNTFLDTKGSPTVIPSEVIRSTVEERNQAILNLQTFKNHHEKEAAVALNNLRSVVENDGNIFEELMETVKVCTLGQITHQLYELGGKYRRNM